jgi:hypothetical protein
MLYSEIIAVCSQIHTKYINTLCGQNVELCVLNLVVHIVTTVCSEIHIKHINTLCVQNVEFLGAFANLRKATISFDISVHPSVCLSLRTEQLDSLWMDIDEIWYLDRFHICDSISLDSA